MLALGQISAISITEASFKSGNSVVEAGRDIWCAKICIITLMGSQSL